MAAKKPEKKQRPKQKKFIKKLNARNADRHILYEASVQCVEADLDFFERVFKKKRKRPLRYIREDFCGTAALACEFLRRHPDNTAIGVDLDQPTLDWGMRHHVSRLGDAAGRLALFNDDVRTVNTPPVDMIAALNFSYSVFKTRDELRLYFSRAREGLNEEGLFILDAFGGTDAMDELEEERKVTSGATPDGTPLPPFIYIWDQASFNVVNHHILCHIHFKFPDKSKMKRAFTYDWRLWTLPELQEIMLEAGFARADVYLEGWDDEEDEADGIFRRRKHFDNMAGWVGYVVGSV